jgi:hypothetical protein
MENARYAMNDDTQMKTQVGKLNMIWN